MSSKPTHTAYVVSDGGRQQEKSAVVREIGTVWTHGDAGGFDVVLPPGVTVSGRIVIRKRKEPNAAEQPAA